MRQKAHEVIVQRFNEAAGRSDCTEAVVVQSRPRWTLAAMAGLVLVVLVLARLIFDPGALVRALIVGVVIALAATFLQTGHWLGRCGDTVVLVQAAKRMSGPHAVVGEWPYPVPASVGKGLGTKRVTLDGQSYVLSITMEREFRAITGIDEPPISTTLSS